MISLITELLPRPDGGLAEEKNGSDSSLASPGCRVQGLTLPNANFPDTKKGPNRTAPQVQEPLSLV